MPGEILDSNESLKMQVEDSETSELLFLNPDMVVLSVGLQPSAGAEELAGHLGIINEEIGFFKPLTEKLHPVETIVPGIYVAGTATAPRDIPDCVAQGGAAAMRAFTDAIRPG